MVTVEDNFSKINKENSPLRISFDLFVILLKNIHKVSLVMDLPTFTSTCVAFDLQG